jgi:hypothetical protein
MAQTWAERVVLTRDLVAELRRGVFVMAGPAPGEAETLTLDRLQSIFKTLQAAADYLDGYADAFEQCAEHPEGEMVVRCLTCDEQQMLDIEREHASQCENAYEAGQRDGHEDGFEEGKRWEP